MSCEAAPLCWIADRGSVRAYGVLKICLSNIPVRTLHTSRSLAWASYFLEFCWPFPSHVPCHSFTGFRHSQVEKSICWLWRAHWWITRTYFEKHALPVRELSNLSLMTSPFVHILALLPGLEIDRSPLPHPGCQEAIDMHTCNYESVEFCDVCLIFICIPHAAHRRRYYVCFLICYSQCFSDSSLEKPFIFSSAQPVIMQLSAGRSLYLLAQLA